VKTWSDGRIINGKALTDSFAFPLHYAGPAVWEGLRSYVQDDGTCKIWKLKEHVVRLLDSAKVLGMTIPYTVSQIEKACQDIVEANGNKDLYLRPIAFVEGDAEGIHTNAGKVRLDIYCVPVPKLHKNSGSGIKMMISNVIRSYPQFNMQVKTPANYAILSSVKGLLEQTGTQDAFLIDNGGYIVEATVANFFVIKGDLIMTPPNDGSILPGITRACVASIVMDRTKMFSKYKKVPVLLEKPITKTDLYTADCVILCGTYAEIVRVSEIDGKKIDGDDFYARMLEKEYSDLVRGRK
jgi:branched-chain amino acid aminotransferase